LIPDEFELNNKITGGWQHGVTWKVDKVKEDTYQPPALHTGDKILKGKFKNSPATIKGFTKDKHNQPVLKTDKGAVQLFKPRVTKLMTNEGLSHPIICVDVQPEYANGNEGVCQKIIQFVAKSTGPVLFFVNAEDQGLSGDTVDSIMQYWDETVGYVENEEGEYSSQINWSRFKVADKGFGYLRSWMDHGIEPSTIVATIREMYAQQVNDTRELRFPGFNRRTPTQSLIQGAIDEMEDDPMSVGWASLSLLKQFSGAYIVGGGRNECLREVELLMNAFNIKYKRIDSLVY
jgi:hypothetical protein